MTLFCHWSFQDRIAIASSPCIALYPKARTIVSTPAPRTRGERTRDWMALQLENFRIYARPFAGEEPRLRTSKDPVDASFLVQSVVYDYGADPFFVGEMSRAIREVSTQMAAIQDSGQPIRFADLWGWLESIGGTRRRIAYGARTEAPESFGRKLPTNVREEAEFMGLPLTRATRAVVEDAHTQFGGYMDEVRRDDRHAPYFVRASRLAARQREPSERPSIEIDGQVVPLSYFKKARDTSTGETLYLLLHPSGVQMTALKREAYRLLLEVLNRRTLDEQVVLDKMARAYFLLMHATPFERGSPAIVESLLDSILRVRLGYSFPLKKVDEPFWKVHFWNPKNGEFLWEDLISCWEEA